MSLSFKFLSVVIVVGCSVGLIFQLKEVSTDYFRYQTDTKVHIQPHFKTKVPILSACIKVVDVYDCNQVAKRFGAPCVRRDGSWRNWDEWSKIWPRLTIADILNLTPPVDQVLSVIDRPCLVRKSSNDVAEYTANECYKFFTITKYFHRESICYKLAPNMGNEWLHIEDYTLKDFFFGTLFKIDFNETLFSDSRVVTGAVHEAATIHLHDTMMSPFIEFKESNQFFIKFTYNTIEQQLKEPPFDTDCQMYPRGDSGTVRRLWLIQNETVKTLNRSIPDVMHSQPLNTGVLTVKARDPEYQVILDKFSRRGRNTCTTRSTISRVAVSPFGAFVFGVSWPDGLMVNIKSTPKSGVIDYIVYVCSCIGFWFGFSVLSLNDVIEWIKVKISGRKTSAHGMVATVPSSGPVNVPTRFIRQVELDSLRAAQQKTQMQVNAMRIELRTMQLEHSEWHLSAS